MTGKQSISFDLECVELPDYRILEYNDLRLGIQEKKEVKQDVACSVRQARFMFALDVEIEGESVRFRGPVVQGTPGDQFVYLVWGKRDGEMWTTIRRLKVPLSNIGVERITRAIETNQPLAMRIVMTNSRGEPISASLKPNQFEWL
ncbi:MAG: DUF5990 family protein [Anaerolineales bacterium]